MNHKLATRRVLACTALALVLGNGAAAERPAADAPAAAAERRALQLVGEARLKVLFWSVYDSRLYTPDGSYEAGERPLRLEIEYLLDIRAEDLVRRTAREWEALEFVHPQQDAWLARLRELWPDVQKNDVLTLELGVDDRAVFYNNGRRLGVIDDPEFGEQFIAIWLSPRTTRPDLRLALLGRNGGAS
jgi:hypothetical protein